MAPPKTPLLTTDCVVLDMDDRVLLVTRKHPPFEGWLALPGGFVDLNESVEDACRREVLEEAGVRIGTLQLVGVYSKPGRDPRGPTCSVAYLARTRQTRIRAGDDAAAAVWMKDWRRADLAFDHRLIIVDAVRLTKRK